MALEGAAWPSCVAFFHTGATGSGPDEEDASGGPPELAAFSAAPSVIGSRTGSGVRFNCLPSHLKALTDTVGVLSESEGELPAGPPPFSNFGAAAVRLAAPEDGAASEDDFRSSNIALKSPVPEFDFDETEAAANGIGAGETAEFDTGTAP
jgi:hypothetical protein